MNAVRAGLLYLRRQAGGTERVGIGFGLRTSMDRETERHLLWKGYGYLRCAKVVAGSMECGGAMTDGASKLMCVPSGGGKVVVVVC